MPLAGPCFRWASKVDGWREDLGSKREAREMIYLVAEVLEVGWVLDPALHKGVVPWRHQIEQGRWLVVPAP